MRLLICRLFVFGSIVSVIENYFDNVIIIVVSVAVVVVIENIRIPALQDSILQNLSSISLLLSDLVVSLLQFLAVL
jgi:hypothetical protein